MAPCRGPICMTWGLRTNPRPQRQSRRADFLDRSSSKIRISPRGAGMRSSLAVAALCALVFVASPADSYAQGATGFLNRTLTVAGETYRYQVYVPADYNQSRIWPVVLFLHGGGERGTDGLVQTEVGIGSAIRRF